MLQLAPAGAARLPRRSRNQRRRRDCQARAGGGSAIAKMELGGIAQPIESFTTGGRSRRALRRQKSKRDMKSWKVASASLPPYLSPGVRRCSAIVLRLAGAPVFFGLEPLIFVASNNETFSRHQLARVLFGLQPSSFVAINNDM